MKIFEITNSHRTVQNGSVFYTDENGQFHRDGDLPAIEWADGSKDYYIHGEKYTPKDAPQKPKVTVVDNPRNFSKEITVTYPDGTVVKGREYGNGEMHYFDKKGQVHRDGDKPAKIYPDGKLEWYIHGRLHRDGDQPAIIKPNGEKTWYKNGNIHRDGDKPAGEWKDELYWSINGQAHRDGDQPAEIKSNGEQIWWQHGKIHRDGDKPAVMRPDGERQWWRKGQLHRDDDKPAIMHPPSEESKNGYPLWYVGNTLVATPRDRKFTRAQFKKWYGD